MYEWKMLNEYSADSGTRINTLQSQIFIQLLRSTWCIYWLFTPCPKPPMNQTAARLHTAISHRDAIACPFSQHIPLAEGYLRPRHPPPQVDIKDMQSKRPSLT